MLLPLIALSMGLLLVPVCGQAATACPVAGERVQWIADLCMAQLQTDDEIAAMACIDQELQRPFADDCAAKRHYKRALCESAVTRQAYPGTVESCLADGEFMGSTVRSGGVGN